MKSILVFNSTMYFLNCLGSNFKIYTFEVTNSTFIIIRGNRHPYVRSGGYPRTLVSIMTWDVYDI